MSETPRAVHTTLRHLSSIVSRGETQIREAQRAIEQQYQYHPNLTDQQVSDLQKTIVAKRKEIAPVRKALAALATVIGEGLV